MKFLSIYLPFILQSVLQVQATLPTLKGQSKKQIATALVTLGAGIAGNAPESHTAAIGQYIDGLIPVLQATGVLVKDQIPTSTAVATPPKP